MEKTKLLVLFLLSFCCNGYAVPSLKQSLCDRRETQYKVSHYAKLLEGMGYSGGVEGRRIGRQVQWHKHGSPVLTYYTAYNGQLSYSVDYADWLEMMVTELEDQAS